MSGLEDVTVLVDPILVGISVNSPPYKKEPFLVAGLVDVHWGPDLDFEPWPFEWQTEGLDFGPMHSEMT